MSLLSVQDVSVTFGGLKAVRNVTFDVPEHSIVSVIGPNGAGKTSLFNAITGVYQPSSGVITVNGVENAIPLSFDANFIVGSKWSCTWITISHLFQY